MDTSTDPRLLVDYADTDEDTENSSKKAATSRLEEESGSSGDSNDGNSRFLRVASAESDSYISDADENGKKENLEELSKDILEEMLETETGARMILGEPEEEEEEGASNVSTMASSAKNSFESEDTAGRDSVKEDEEELDPDGWLDVLGSGRLRKRVLVAGDKHKGRPAQGAAATITVAVRFDGRVVDPETEVLINVSENEVVAAVDLVVPLMHQGETCEVITDPDFAYGKIGLPSKGIPPNAALHIEVKLVEFDFAPDVPSLSVAKRMEVGTRKKDRGNFWYAREEFQNAIQCYRKSSEYFDDERLDFDVPMDRYSLPEELQLMLEERIKTLNNLAQAQIRVEAFEAAFGSLKQVLRIDPNNEKALYRKSKILQEKGQVDEALGILRRINRLFPENKQAKADIAKLTQVQKRHRQNDIKMSRKMLGLDDSASKSKAAPRGKWSWLRTGLTFGLVAGSVGAAVLATALYKKM